MTRDTGTRQSISHLVVLGLFCLVLAGCDAGAAFTAGSPPACAIALGGYGQNYQTWTVTVDGSRQTWSAANDHPHQALPGPLWKVGDVVWYSGHLYRVKALNTSTYTMRLVSVQQC